MSGWSEWWSGVEDRACRIGVTLRELKERHRAFARWFSDGLSVEEAVLAFAMLVNDSDLVEALLPTRKEVAR